ncbi:hypothetical protein EDB87DRAFT_1621104 [Lactarius vividus]|nr:hypothetical protein EDB87DRAFT_1621104 [Lactarius vividus]
MSNEDWQIDCAAQICSALMPALPDVQKLRLDFDGGVMPTKWKNGEIDGTTWHELLRSFIGVNELCICAALSEEVSRALEVGEAGLDPELLPSLQEIEFEFYGKMADKLSGSFIHARRVAGRPVTLVKPVDHVVALNNFLQRSPEGNVCPELTWQMIQEGPNNQAIYQAVAMARGITFGMGRGVSRGLAKRAAAKEAFGYLSKHGLPEY